MLESQTDEVCFFQSQWLVFHLQCHYSLTEQLRAALVKAPPAMLGLMVQRQDGNSRGALGVAVGCGIHMLPNLPDLLCFNFPNPELNFSNNF